MIRSLRHLHKISLSLFLVLPAVSLAAPISPDLSITGEVSLDASFAEPTSVYNGTLYSGVETSTFSESSFTGNNPVVTTITETGQGLGHTLEMSQSAESFDFIAIDYFFSMTNSSSDDYELTFGNTFFNHVNADGTDAFADSEFSIFSTDSTGNPLVPFEELFFTDLTSDLVFGDFVDGSDNGTFGEDLQDSGTDFFSFSLTAGSSLYFSATLLADAGIFDSSSSYLLEMDSFIYLSEATKVGGTVPVPEPGSLALMLAGLGVFLRRNQQKKRT